MYATVKNTVILTSYYLDNIGNCFLLEIVSPIRLCEPTHLSLPKYTKNLSHIPSTMQGVEQLAIAKQKFLPSWSGRNKQYTK